MLIKTSFPVVRVEEAACIEAEERGEEGGSLVRILLVSSEAISLRLKVVYIGLRLLIHA